MSGWIDPKMNGRIRPFELDDCEAVKDLCDWAWWFKRSPEGWRWLTGGAPGTPHDATAPAGWVCETTDVEVRAFLGNFLQRFDYRGEVFLGASLHTLLVHPDVRGASRDLLRRFAGQQAAFVRYTFNANDRSAPIYRHFDMHPWPQELSRVKYLWRTDWPGVVSERALRWVHGLSSGASRPRGERFETARVWTGVFGPCEPGVTPIPVGDIDERFDRLWDRLRLDCRLLAWRDAATLRWRCSDPDLTREPLLLAYETDGELAGYLFAFFSKGSEVERPALEIIDLIATEAVESVALPAMIRSLLRSARAMGASRVRLPFVSPKLDALLSEFAAARRVYAYDHCHLRWIGPGGPEFLGAWYATPFDGDYSFCLRPPPRIAATRAAA